MPPVTMSVRMDEKLKLDLRAWAKANKTSVNDVIVRLVKREIDEAKSDLPLKLEEARSRVKLLTRVSLKLVDKPPGGKVTPGDFEDDEEAGEYIRDYMEDDRPGTEADEWKDGLPRGPIETDHMYAQWDFDRWNSCADRWAEELPNTDIVDEYGQLTSLTRIRITRACELLDDLWLYDLGKQFGLTGISWSNILHGYRDVSPRLRTRISRWLEFAEDEVGPFRPPAELTVVK